MGFLDSGSKKEAKTFLRAIEKIGPNVIHSSWYEGMQDYEKLWRDTPIAEREKIFKEHFSADSVLHFDTSPVVGGRICDFGKKVVKNPEKEAKKEFSELPEILRADIIQLVYALGNRLASREEIANQDRKAVQEDVARLRRMDESNQGRGLNRSGNVRFTDTWKIGIYSFTCTVEYWASEDTANASWFGGTDYKIGGASIPCYAIYIKIDPTPEYYRLKEIHGWIRQVRPFKGHFGPGNISQYWKTSQTGQEEEILKEIRPCILYGFAEVPYAKDRTDAQLTAIEEKLEEFERRKKKLNHEIWVRSGGPERKAAAAKAAAERRVIEEVAAKAAAERRAIEERDAAAVAKEKARQDSFTQAKYEKLAIVGSWWNGLSEKEKGKYIENESMVNYEKVLNGDFGAIPNPTDNFNEIFDPAKDIVVDWYKKYGAKSSPTKRRRWFR